MDYLLVADVGGTNTRLYLIEVDPNTVLTFQAKRGSRAPGREILTRSFLNQDYRSLRAIIEIFIAEAGIAKICCECELAAHAKSLSPGASQYEDA